MHGGACLADLECSGHQWEEEPLTLLVQWFLARKNVVRKKVARKNASDEVS